MNPSGVRITPAVTTLGMVESEMEFIADKMLQVAQNINNEVLTRSARGSRVYEQYDLAAI